MPLRIVLDVRHIKDFGVGTYSPESADCSQLGGFQNHYLLTVLPNEVHELSGLGANFEIVVYHHQDSEQLDHILFPLFLRKLAPDLVHMPLNQIPFLMPKPYVVTIHDLTACCSENVRACGRTCDYTGFGAACCVPIGLSPSRRPHGVTLNTCWAFPLNEFVRFTARRTPSLWIIIRPPRPELRPRRLGAGKKAASGAIPDRLSVHSLFRQQCPQEYSAVG